MRRYRAIVILFVCAIFIIITQTAMALEITSPAFAANQSIPTRFTCQGEDINPPLTISGIPEGTQTLALIVDDPDAPMGTWVHWVVFNMPPLAAIQPGDIPGQQARSSFPKMKYGGPCPPSGTHRYFFKLYALDTALDPALVTDKATLLAAMQGHILEQAELVGLYQKIRSSF